MKKHKLKILRGGQDGMTEMERREREETIQRENAAREMTRRGWPLIFFNPLNMLFGLIGLVGGTEALIAGLGFSLTVSVVLFWFAVSSARYGREP